MTDLPFLDNKGKRTINSKVSFSIKRQDIVKKKDEMNPTVNRKTVCDRFCSPTPPSLSTSPLTHITYSH